MQMMKVIHLVKALKPSSVRGDIQKIMLNVLSNSMRRCNWTCTTDSMDLQRFLDGKTFIVVQLGTYVYTIR